MKDVVVVIGAGGIGQAIARRVGAGRHVVLADLRLDAAQAASKILGDAGLRQAQRRRTSQAANRYARLLSMRRSSAR